MNKEVVQKVGLLIMGFSSGFVLSGMINRGERVSGMVLPFLVLVAGVILALVRPKK